MYKILRTPYKMEKSTRMIHPPPSQWCVWAFVSTYWLKLWHYNFIGGWLLTSTTQRQKDFFGFLFFCQDTNIWKSAQIKCPTYYWTLHVCIMRIRGQKNFLDSYGIFVEIFSSYVQKCFNNIYSHIEKTTTQEYYLTKYGHINILYGWKKS